MCHGCLQPQLQKKHTIEHLKMIMSTPSAIYIILKRGGLFYIYDLYLPYHIDRYIDR